MSRSHLLGLGFMTPALLLVALFFVAPVLLTAVFSMTNMSTATGITGGAYAVSDTALLKIVDAPGGGPALKEKLSATTYAVDEAGLGAIAKAGTPALTVDEIRQKLLGKSFTDSRDMERTIRDLSNRPNSTRDVKAIADQFRRSVYNARFDSREALLATLSANGIALTPDETKLVADSTYTGWTWSLDNLRRMVSVPNNLVMLGNTLFYVVVTLTVFNVGYALFLAIATHFMPSGLAGTFRAIWLLPRITPGVLYVLLWKWFAWDTGFLSHMLTPLGIAQRNWMLDTSTHAWVFVVLINGFVGASMGMLIFSSAIAAIPKPLFHAAEVDGASRWQQIRHIILPQMRWPILFVSCYQTLSLLTSFELILLATGGGPGSSTTVWALGAYQAALNNYAGNLQYGYGAALSLVMVIIGVSLSLIYMRLFKFDALVTRPRIEL